MKITRSQNYKKGYLKQEKSEFIYFHNISLIIVKQYRINIGPGQKGPKYSTPLVNTEK